MGNWQVELSNLMLVSIALGMEQNFNKLSIGGKQLRTYFYVITLKN